MAEMIRIRGAVLNEAGQPLPGAHVFQDIDRGAVGMATNADGIYAFEATVGVPVRITYVGYIEQQFEPDTTEPEIFTMAPAVYELPGGEVFGDKPKGKSYAGVVVGLLTLLALIAANDD